METNTTSPDQVMTQEQLLIAIYENTTKTKKYMQWQFYITIVLVVLPLLAMAFIIPSILSSLSGAYAGVLQ